MKNSYKVYVLYSNSFKKSYVGQTQNIDERLRKHNKGKVKSTKIYRPWRVIYFETFCTRSEAMKRERWLKSGKGRDFLKWILHPPQADVP